MNKTIAQQLNIKDFPFIIKDKNGNEIYFENSTGYWVKSEYDQNGNRIYFEYSNGGYWNTYYKKYYNNEHVGNYPSK